MKSKLVIECFFAMTLWANATPPFRAEGTVQCDDRLSGIEQLYEFSITVRDCQWQAKLVWDDNRIEASSVGEEIFKIMNGPYYGQEPLAAVRRAAFPVDHPHPVLPVLWTAFASQCWFNKEATAIFPPDAGYGRQVPCILERFHESPRLPKRIVFVNEGVTNQREKLPKPFDKGFRMGEYSVPCVTNWAGITLPIQFTLLGFQPNLPGQSSNDVSLIYRIEGVVTNIETQGIHLHGKPSFLGHGAISTLDFRFASFPLKYVTNRWLDRTEVLQTAEYKVWKERFATNSTSFAPLRTTYVACTIAILGFAAALWRRGKKNKTKHTK